MHALGWLLVLCCAVVSARVRKATQDASLPFEILPRNTFDDLENVTFTAFNRCVNGAFCTVSGQ
jgi:hypothetical protein